MKLTNKTKDETPIDRTKLSAVNKSFSNKEVQEAIKDDEKSKNKNSFIYIILFLIIIGAITYLSITNFNKKAETNNSEVSSSTDTISNVDPTLNASDEIVEVDCTQYNKVQVPEDYPTIQEALDQAGMQSDIEISAGTYNENLVISGAVCLTGTGEVIIKGAEATQPTITILGGNTKISGLIIRSDAVEENFDVWQKASCVFVDQEDAMVSITNNFFINCNIAIGAINNAHLLIKDNVITAENNKYGYALTYSEVKSQRNTISGARYGEYFYGCTGEISNDTITGGYYGISTYSSSELSIHNNDLKDIQYAGINYAKNGADEIEENKFENVPNQVFGNEK